MSANIVENFPLIDFDLEFNQHATSFHCPFPIPSYLISIVAGNLKEKNINSRISIISEPENLNSYLDEEKNFELYLKTLEDYIGEYMYFFCITYTQRWLTYRIIIMPPSFPFAGMENPYLNFVSSSIMNNNQFNNVIIHEMAHSWTGNLVTCENWSNLWLNEG